MSVLSFGGLLAAPICVFSVVAGLQKIANLTPSAHLPGDLGKEEAEFHQPGLHIAILFHLLKAQRTSTLSP